MASGVWGLQAHLGQQKIRLIFPPTSLGHNISKAWARRAKCVSKHGQLGIYLTRTSWAKQASKQTDRQKYTHPNPVTQGIFPSTYLSFNNNNSINHNIILLSAYMPDTKLGYIYITSLSSLKKLKVSSFDWWGNGPQRGNLRPRFNFHILRRK